MNIYTRTHYYFSMSKSLTQLIEIFDGLDENIKRLVEADYKDIITLQIECDNNVAKGYACTRDICTYAELLHKNISQIIGDLNRYYLNMKITENGLEALKRNMTIIRYYSSPLHAYRESFSRSIN